MHRRIWLAGLIMLLLSVPAEAWSYKEHALLTRLAAMKLIDDPATPEAMKQWLRQAAPDLRSFEEEKQFLLQARVGRSPAGTVGLSYWSIMPDEHALNDPRESKLEPFGVHERLLHYVDLELLVSGDQKRGYRADLSGLPPIEQVPRDMSDPRYIQAGMLPFRVEQCYQKLVEALRDGRMLGDAEPPAQDVDSAQRWAGYLAHYVADNTQPHHATVDYRSQSYFNHRRTAPNIHSEIEWRMVDDEKQDFPELRREFWPLFVQALEHAADPSHSRDPWQATLEIAYFSYEALPLIGEAAVAATEGDAIDTEAFFRHRGTVRGEQMSVMEMKARQQALAVLRIAKMWRQAWDEAR